MSQNVIITLTCDIPGPHQCGDVRTVTVSLNGDSYESEMCASKRKTVAGELAPFIAAARKIPAGAPAARAAAPRWPVRDAGHRRRTAGIRDWARENGYAVSDSGAFTNTVLAAYHAAHPAARRQ